MALAGSALFSLQILLILGFLCNFGQSEVLGPKDVCLGKNVKHLITFLEEEHVKEMENNIESKATINQILQLNLHESKTHQEKIEKLETTLESVKMQMLDIANLVKRQGCQKLLLWADVKKSNLISAAGKHFYFNAANEVNWFGARDWCAERGMRRASLKTLSEIESVLPQLKKAAKWFWLSGSDIGRSPGQFRWADGSSVDSSLWSTGYPKNYGDEEQMCTDFYIDDGKLVDNDCTSAGSNILCEVPEALATCL